MMYRNVLVPDLKNTACLGPLPRLNTRSLPCRVTHMLSEICQVRLTELESTVLTVSVTCNACLSTLNTRKRSLPKSGRTMNSPVGSSRAWCGRGTLCCSFPSSFGMSPGCTNVKFWRRRGPTFGSAMSKRLSPDEPLGCKLAHCVSTLELHLVQDSWLTSKVQLTCSLRRTPQSGLDQVE